VLDAVIPSLLLGAREGHLAGRGVAVALGVAAGVSDDELAGDIDGTSEGLNAETLARGVGDGERATSATGEGELTTNSGALRGVVPPAAQIGGLAGAVSSLGATTLETSIAVSSGTASPLAARSLAGLGLDVGIAVGNEAIDAIADLLTLSLAPQAALGIGACQLALIRGLEVAAGNSHRNGNKTSEESDNSLHCTKWTKKTNS